MTAEYDPYAHLQPWDQRPNEPNTAYKRFVYYRDLGPTRSFRKVAEHFELKLGTIYGFSKDHKWVYRAAAYDREQDREDQEWLADERRKAKLRHVKQAQSLQSKWIQGLQNISPQDLDAKDVIKYAEIATKLERQALGLEDTHVNVSGNIEHSVEALSPDETRLRLEELQKEIGSRLAENRSDEDSDTDE